MDDVDFGDDAALDALLRLCDGIAAEVGGQQQVRAGSWMGKLKFYEIYAVFIWPLSYARHVTACT